MKTPHAGTDKAFVHFKFATHMWNAHEESAYDLTLTQLSELHRHFNCPPGTSGRYLGCRLRTAKRLTARP